MGRRNSALASFGWVAIAAVGIAGGFFSARWAGSDDRKAPRHTERSVGREYEVAAPQSTRASPMAIVASASVPTATQGSSRVPAEEQGDATAQDGIDPASWGKRTEERHFEQLRAHEAEPRDDGWARVAESSFRSDMGLVDGGAVLRSVSCRTTTCVARLSFADYETAQNGFAAFLHARFSLNCARSIVLPEPDDKSSPYDASLFLDCEHARVEEAEQ